MVDRPVLRKRKIREEKKPACDACRAHKLRCDAYLDYSRPCSRCSKKRITCIVLQDRRMKESPSHSQISQSISPQENDGRTPYAPYSTTSFAIRPSASAPVIAPPAGYAGITPIAIPNVEETSIATLNSDYGVNHDTEPRTLNQVCVEASLINVCFSRFNRYYAPIIPILSRAPKPNEAFRECPLKFWAIVAIGSRKCLEDPTLFSSLSPLIESMAMASLCFGRTSPYPVIEGLLLMCTWHLSTERPYYKSIYAALSSALMTFTIQAGTHHGLSLQGVVTQTTTDTARVARLCAYAVLVHQRTFAILGYPTHQIVIPQGLGLDSMVSLPGGVVAQMRMAEIVCKTQRIISELQLGPDRDNLETHLRSLVPAFEDELISAKESHESEGALSKINFATTRLQIRALTFLNTKSQTDRIELTQLSTSAILLMDAITEADDAFLISHHCPDYIFHGVMLAGCTVVKLAKSYPPSFFSESDQTRAIFAAINMCRNISVGHNDIPSRVADIIGHLWSNPKAYRDADGGYVTPLHIRNRLTMSVVYDCLWWWRKLSTDFPQQLTSQSNVQPQASGVADTGESTIDFNQAFLDEPWSWGIDWDTFESLEPIL